MSKENNSLAVVAYLTWIGLLIAFIQNQNEKNRLTSFHVRQSFGLYLGYIATALLGVMFIFGGIFFLGIFAVLFLYIYLFAVLIFWFILWLIGLIAAANGEEKPVPIFGRLFQRWFGNPDY